MKKVLLFFALMLAMAAQADVLGEYSFVGTLGDKIPVRLKFAVNGDEIAVGEIFYPKAKNPAPILVVGARNGCRLRRCLHEGEAIEMMADHHGQPPTN